MAVVSFHPPGIEAQTAAGQSGDAAGAWARPFLSRSVQRKVRGRLVSADEAQIVIDVPNPEPWTSPRHLPTRLNLDDVQKVSVRKEDSIGAAFDSSIQGTEEIYRQPSTARTFAAESPAGIRFRVRF
jgi:hypothetical protein